MKKISFILILMSLILCITVLSSCGNENAPDANNGEETDTIVTTNGEAPGTGYPSGQIQREYICYGDVVWVYDTNTSDLQALSELPNDFTFIGQTLLEDPYEIPIEDFHTAHINVGRNVYISSSGDAVYVEIKDGMYYRFVPAE